MSFCVLPWLIIQLSIKSSAKGMSIIMKRRLFLCLVMSMILLVVGCGQNNEVDQSTLSEEAPPEEPVQKTVQTFGTVQTKEVQGIMLDLPANIQKIHVQEGDKVKKGDTLITLNLKEIQGQIQEKEDALKVSKLEVEKMVAQKDDNSQIQQSENNLQSIENEYNELNKELNNKAEFLKEGVISQNEYDEFKKTVDNKAKEVENSKLALDSLKQNSEVNKKVDNLNLEIKKQNVEALERSLEILQEKIKESGLEGNKIICDVENGVVNKIDNAVGDRLNPEKQIMSILDIDTLVVKANVVEDFIKDVSLGNKAVIVPLADTEKQYEGIVTRIANMAIVDNGETVIPVEITVENVDEFLLPNSNVNIQIIVE